MQMKPLYGLILGALLATPSVHAQQAQKTDWVLRHREATLQIYTRDVAHSKIDAVKVHTRFASTLDDVAGLLLDTRRRQRWDALCTQAQWINEARDGGGLLYLYYDMPWPVADRDMVMKTTVTRHANRVLIRSDAVASPLYTDSGAQRVSKAWYEWRLESVGEDTTEVTAVMFMDPAGPIPAWLLNYLSVTQPGKNIATMRALLETP